MDSGRWGEGTSRSREFSGAGVLECNDEGGKYISKPSIGGEEGHFARYEGDESGGGPMPRDFLDFLLV